MQAAKVVPENDDKIPYPQAQAQFAPPEAIAISSRSEQYVQKLEEQPAGLLANVATNTETPKQVLGRVLLPGEVVLADFDCYFPYKILPRWKIIMYCVMTCGLYLFVLLARSIERWCYRMKCCTPQTLEYVRGKMAVTSKGRLICWTLDVKQRKDGQTCCGSCLGCCCKICCPDLCAAPARYNVENVSRIFLMDQVREISHFYRSRAAMCFCLCNDYACGVKISVLQFDHGGKAQPSVVNSYPANHYLAAMRINVGAALELLMSSVESALNVSSTGSALFLTSSSVDRMHVDDAPLVFDDLATLSARFLNALPKVKDIVQPSGNENISNMKSSDQVAGLRVIYDDNTVTIPNKWLPMLPEEKVVSVTGQVFTMTKKDWFFTFLTLGYHYIVNIRHRKFLRSALVLTTQRVVVVDIYQRAGIIPNNLIAFTYQVTSYFPGKIKAGYYRGIDKHNLEAGILTDGGELRFSLYNHQKSLPFAKALQMSTVRQANPAIDMVPTTRDNLDSLPANDKDFLVLLPKEEIVDVMLGQVQYEPFCRPYDFPQSLVCIPCSMITGNVMANEPMCSRSSCGPWFPVCGQIVTCLLRPFERTSNVVLTNSSVINIIHQGNNGVCGKGLCKKRWFVVSWAPLGDVQGHVLNLHTYGQDTCFRRCCAKCGGSCAQCFPISNNEAHLGISMGGYSFGLEMQKQNHNFLTDDKIMELTTKLSNLEAGLHQESMQR